MSDPEALVRLQVMVREKTRKRLKSLSIDMDLEMGELNDLVLEYMLPLLSAEKAPAPLGKAIAEFKKAKEAKAKEAEEAGE